VQFYPLKNPTPFHLGRPYLLICEDKRSDADPESQHDATSAPVPAPAAPVQTPAAPVQIPVLMLNFRGAPT
jgi:hypothetical protein